MSGYNPKTKGTCLQSPEISGWDDSSALKIKYGNAGMWNGIPAEFCDWSCGLFTALAAAYRVLSLLFPSNMRSH